jgi:glycosyltransferase involved in cell wall biosynthesis
VTLRHRILFDLQATQSQAHADRGVARYVKDHIRALRQLGVGDALLLNPNLPFPRTLDPELLTSLDLKWATQTEVRRIVEAGDRPAAFYLTSPIEISMWPDGDLPSHLLRGGLPVVGTLYDLIPLLFPDRYLTRVDLERRYRARIEQLHHLDLVLTISEHTRRDALQHLGLDPAKVHAIGFGTSPFFRPVEPGDQPDVAIARHTPDVRRPYVLTVLGGDPRKNAERLFEAWALARREAGLDHQLVVTCSLDPDTQARWEGSARQQGLAVGSDVVLTNWQPDDVLRALYQRCDLFVLPALYEGAGLPPAEAMVCGAPVITSSTSSMPEVLDWTPSTFHPESVEDMAARIVQGVTDDAFRAELLKRGAERRGLLTWDQVARRTVDALERLPEPAGPVVLPTRIALVGPTPPTPSGIADYNARLIPALAERCEVDVFTTSDGRTHEHPNLRWFPMRALRDTCTPWSYDAVVYTVGNSDHHHQLYNLAEEFPGIVWMHDVRLPGLYLTYAEATFAKPETQDEFLRSRLLQQYRRRTPKHLEAEPRRTPAHYNDLGIGLVQELAQRARGVVVSSALAGRLLELDLQPDARTPPSWVLPLAVPEPWGDGSGRAPAERPVLVSLGMVSPLKGAEQLVAALASLRSSGCDATLVFVGPVDDGYRDHLARQAEALGVADHVEITGHVSEAEYRGWLARATAAVQLRVSTNGESSAAVTDALAAGLPVVTNVHAATELPPGTVALVPSDVDPSRLAAELRSVLVPDRLRGLAEAGHAFARSWGFADVADRLLALVRELA